MTSSERLYRDLLESTEQLPTDIFDPQKLHAVISVLLERIRQEGKWGEQNHGLHFWNTILMEEMGEYCKDLYEHFSDPTPERAARVRKELVETCAVALAMIECIDRNGIKHV